MCFFTITSLQSGILFEFFDNSAPYGVILYGGYLDTCSCNNNSDHFLLGIDYFKNISRYKPTPGPLAISSDPARLCLCSNNAQIDCTTRNLSATTMSGGTINLMAIAINQDSNPGSAIIGAHYLSSQADLDVGEARKEIRQCTEISYHVFTTQSSATLLLHIIGNCEQYPHSNITINIDLRSCSRGFELKKDRCVCERRLINYNIACNFYSQSVSRTGSIWLQYDEQHLKIHRNCPLDYCQVASDTISLERPDEQCANNCSGVICGACQDNHSIALGGSKCLPCNSERYTFMWLLVVFAVTGVALVALLLVCNMTISTGTLNGLILYANVVSISGITSLQNCSIHPILSVFIAWVNLDFGVQTCFYPGMDTYQKTWLQFAFPLYIWLLVAAITAASYYSSTAMRVFGRNNIAILATLFLLSYSKILKTIITALSSTQVLVSSADNVSDQLVPHRVWTYDGNIEYLQGKHVPLFAVALVLLVFLFLPYTLLLLFGQCVRSTPIGRRWVLRLVRSTAFISIMDAYHAPYNKRHRYWTGLMLLTRCVLFLAFATVRTDDHILGNMYITTLATTGILSYKTFTIKIYRNIYLNTLEFCFLINLQVLSATLYYLKGSSDNNSALCRTITASISISFSIFIIILAYHACLRLEKTKCYTSMKAKFFPKAQTGQHPATFVDTDADTRDIDAIVKLPTTTLVELREPLLASDGCKQD